MTDRESFQLASIAFGLMTILEQGFVLVIFSAHKNKHKSIMNRWIDAVASVAKTQNDKPNEDQR